MWRGRRGDGVEGKTCSRGDGDRDVREQQDSLDFDGTSIELGVIHGRDGSISSGAVGEGDETEASGALGLAVAKNDSLQTRQHTCLRP